MHRAVVVDLDQVPEGVSAAEAIEHLAELLVERPDTPCAFLLPASAHDDLTPESPGLDVLASRAELVRTAMGSPDPTVLPYPVLERLLQREADGATRLGLEGISLLLQRPWPPHLLPLLRRNGIHSLVLPDRMILSPGVAVYLDAVVPVVPWSRSVASDGDSPSVVLVGLGEAARALDEIPPDGATTPSGILELQVITGRAAITDEGWPTDPELDLIRRKTIRLATRIPERTADEVLDRVSRVASVLGSPPPAETRHAELIRAHTELIAARKAIDGARRRGDDWSKATRLDWDADGSEDLHIETPALSLVLDLPEGGTILVLDDKRAVRPLGTLIDGPIGHLLRHQTLDDEAVDTGTLGVERLEESRERTAATLSGAVAGGEVECDLTLEGLSLRLAYRVSDLAAGRFGPELALSIPGSRLRVDGGEWQELGPDPIAVEGHRFRLAGSDGRTALLSALTPAEAFIRTAAGGAMIWLHWLTPGTGAYELTADLDA